MILRIIVSESDGTNMYSDFTLIPKTTIIGINQIIDDLFNMLNWHVLQIFEIENEILRRMSNEMLGEKSDML